MRRQDGGPLMREDLDEKEGAAACHNLSSRQAAEKSEDPTKTRSCTKSVITIFYTFVLLRVSSYVCGFFSILPGLSEHSVLVF